jgi:signal transduction histidine kinase
MRLIQIDTDAGWLGRLVRVLVVFRLLILVIALVLMAPRRDSSEVAAAVLIAAGLSYLPLRHWPLVARSLQRNCVYVLAEVVVSMLVLGLAGARSSLFFFTLGTAVLVGAVSGRRGAVPFAVVLVAGYELITRAGISTMSGAGDQLSAPTVVLAALYPVAVCAGVAARTMIAHGARTEELVHARDRALAVEQERLIFARELHDSLAKTVEGLAMGATALSRRWARDPQAVAELATALAADARQAALEARALLSGLRSNGDGGLIAQLRGRAAALGARSGIEITVTCLDEAAAADLNTDVQDALVRICGEAVLNAISHGAASHVWVTLAHRSADGGWAMTVTDDGCGMPGPVDLPALRRSGHYGLVGMAERAAGFGGKIRYGTAQQGGIMIDVRLPGAAALPVSVGREDMEVVA